MNMDAALARNSDRIELLTEAMTDVLVLPRLVGRFIVQVQSGKMVKFATDEIPSTGFDRAVMWLLNTTNVVRSRFEEFRRIMGRKAFTVARVLEETVLEKIKRTLASSIEKGEDLDSWKARLELDDEEAGQSIMDQVGVGVLNPYHAETVFRAQWQNSYQVAIREGYERTASTWAYYEYVTMDDDRVRLAHAAMHGVRRLTTDPIWKTWWPPNGYNCRCTVVAISKGEAQASNLRPTDKPPESAQPDEGWEGEPR